MRERRPLHHREQAFQTRQEEVGGGPQLQSQARVEHVGRGQAEMHPPSGRPDRLADRLDERGHVVARDPLELGHPFRGEGRALANGGGVFRRDPAELGPGFDGEDLDLEPVREAGLVGPDGRHLGQPVP
jgi:hypothetical protein